MNKFKYSSIFALTAILFVTACSNDSMEQVEAETDVSFYNQFVPCTPGPDYSSENMRQMIVEWNALEVMSDDLVWAGGYAPKGDSNGQDNGWWELQWPSKEAADVAWEAWMADDTAQAWDNKSDAVLACDNSLVSSWTFKHLEQSLLILILVILQLKHIHAI